MGLARARLRYALRIRRRAQALGPLRRQAQRRARAAVERGRAHGGRGWRRRNRDFKAGGGAELARRVFEGGSVRFARPRVHGFAASRALFQQGGPGVAERDQGHETAIAAGQGITHVEAPLPRPQPVPDTLAWGEGSQTPRNAAGYFAGLASIGASGVGIIAGA